MPAYAVLVVVDIAVPVSAHFAPASVRRAINAVGLRGLTLMHVWRMPAALIPLFGVGLSGASHIIALHALTRPRATGQ
jgi:hypothetical protein